MIYLNILCIAVSGIACGYFIGQGSPSAAVINGLAMAVNIVIVAANIAK